MSDYDGQEVFPDAPQWAKDIPAGEEKVFGIVTTIDGRRLLGAWTVYMDKAFCEQYMIFFDRVADFTRVDITLPDGTPVTAASVRIPS